MATVIKEFTHPLAVTSPLIHGDRVKDAQWLMSGHNRLATHDFPMDFYKGDIDGVYGTDSRAATKLTKKFVGYPLAECNGLFGQTLYEYIRPNNWRPLPAEFRKRREKLLASLAETIGAKALDEAFTHLGYKETPKNWSMFGRWYGIDGQPWCAMFISYCCAKVGGKFHRSYVPDVVDAARNVYDMHFTSNPQYGSLAAYNLHGEHDAHIEFFVRWIVKGHSFYALGGNTGPVNISNGGMVAEQVRYVSTVDHFIEMER